MIPKILETWSQLDWYLRLWMISESSCLIPQSCSSNRHHHYQNITHHFPRPIKPLWFDFCTVLMWTEVVYEVLIENQKALDVNCCEVYHDWRSQIVVFGTETPSPPQVNFERKGLTLQDPIAMYSLVKNDDLMLSSIVMTRPDFSGKISIANPIWYLCKDTSWSSHLRQVFEVRLMDW